MKKFDIHFNDLVPAKQAELLDLCKSLSNCAMDSNDLCEEPLVTICFQEDSDLFHVSDIEWDTEEDGGAPSAESLGLPNELMIRAEDLRFDDDPVNIERNELIDRIADFLSDTYGYCVFGFNVEDDEEA